MPALDALETVEILSYRLEHVVVRNEPDLSNGLLAGCSCLYGMDERERRHQQVHVGASP